MRSLVNAIREVEPGSAYDVDACDHEALRHGVASALFHQYLELQKMNEHTRPQVLRFVAIVVALAARRRPYCSNPVA